ncbi:hypothetical protein BKA66DRAFT_509596 [Pyrenochaeta sp. MPI-SDFR-AT-0127]|nr:hypothetical protein BKA66DRAFT_509596 [Pyrenochaeta sp. MPI-SDFR-AT-0127]
MRSFYIIFPVIWRSIAATAVNGTCRCAPTDKCWPSNQDWAALNQTVDGRLIKTVPLGAVCHDPMYNESECKKIRDTWDSLDIHLNSPTSVMSPHFAFMTNNSCDPFTAKEVPCGFGAYARYAINATQDQHIVAGLRFARNRNIRVTIKNTGHDYLGRSTGAGALAIWTHYLNGGEVIESYQSSTYTGPAIKVGAGTQVEEFYILANNSGLMAVGGECATVGVAGGYTSGGGQSPLSSFAGLAADQTLEFEVITADGIKRRATPEKDQDLYWALSGGGPGYGVVTSVTYKAYPTLPVSGNVFSFERGNVSYDKFWTAIETYHALIPTFANSGGYAFTFVGNESFSMSPLFVINRTKEEVQALVRPLEQKVKALGIPYDSTTTTYTNYYDAWKALIGQSEGANSGISGGRLIPRDTILNNASETSRVLRKVTDLGGQMLQMTIGATMEVASNPNNSVNPAWRDAVMLLFVPGGDGSLSEQQNMITNVTGAMVTKLTPTSGAYMNEADINEPNFQESFYGRNYERLSSIKHKYDPDDIFYAKTAVGSERWKVQSDGKLCKIIG